MKSKPLFFFLLISLWPYLFSCSTGDCGRLVEKLKNYNCKNDKGCIIDMQYLFEVDWNSIYIFHGFNSPEDISDAIGFNCNCDAIYDHTKLILLVKDKRILQSIKLNCSDLDFLPLLTEENFAKVERDNPNLIFTVKDTETGTKYVFNPLNE